MADICVSSHHRSIAHINSDPEFRALANRDGFLIELRLDSYSDLTPTSFNALLERFAPNVIVTYRHPDEGGNRWDAGDIERMKYLQRAADHGVRYIDIEARTARPNFDKKTARVILSYHEFESMPTAEALKKKYGEMAADPISDVVKIACMPETIFETVPMLELLRDKPGKVPLIALAMGEAGFWTRVAGALFDAPLTYARGGTAQGTAPGQPTWLELEDVYRYRDLQRGWPVYGVIGNPIGHSLSPLLHNTALKVMGLPGLYLPFKVENNPSDFVKKFAPLNLRALSVTIPHKEDVFEACAEVHELAASIGAINTLILRPDKSWWGTNTDALAAAESLEAHSGSLYGKNVLVMGAGGAAKAVAFGLKTRGANVFVANRTIEHAVTLAAAVGGTMIKYEDLDSSQNLAAIVNTTPLGMYPDVHRTPLEKEQIPEGSIVFDTVYNPRRTKLLELAAAKGCATVEGVTMFIRQGARQFELYSGARAPLEEIEQVVMEELDKRSIAAKED